MASETKTISLAAFLADDFNPADPLLHTDASYEIIGRDRDLSGALFGHAKYTPDATPIAFLKARADAAFLPMAEALYRNPNLSNEIGRELRWSGWAALSDIVRLRLDAWLYTPMSLTDSCIITRDVPEHLIEHEAVNPAAVADVRAYLQ